MSLENFQLNESSFSPGHNLLSHHTDEHKICGMHLLNRGSYINGRAVKLLSIHLYSVKIFINFD